MTEEKRIYDNNGGTTGEEESFLPEPDIKSVSKLVLATLILVLVIGSLAQAMHFEIGMLITQWLLILPPSLWFWKRYSINKEQFARIRPLAKKYVPAISLLVVCAWLLNMFLAVGLVSFLMKFGYQPLEILPPPDDLRHYLTYLFVIAISAGVCEEVLFRGTVMPSLERYGALPALVFSSLLFALFHLTFLNLLSAFILGLLIGIVVIKTGSILAGIYYHFLNNAIAVTYLYLVADLEPANTVELGDLHPALLVIMVPAFLGLIYALKKISLHSGSPPIFTRGQRWLPRGWLNVFTVLAMIIFLLAAFLEMFLGFNMM